MIGTSSRRGWQSSFYKTYSISGEHLKTEHNQGNCIFELFPKKSFEEKYRNNKGIIPAEENERFYVREYWKQVLSGLDPESIYREIDYSILLSDEPSTEFSHRHIVAAWFEILLNIKVPEMLANGVHTEQISRPDYIKGYLEEAMRQNRNMRGFTSLRALYFFERGEKLEALANELEEKTGQCQDGYRQTACYLRCQADTIEEKYQRSLQEEKLTR
ncbi:MAG: hypothetical protein IKR74_04005 [Bacilli bacterium]|nr:hypothetical protein [Bacilli bacterium]